MMDLKELVFFRAKAELDAYIQMAKAGGYTEEEVDGQSYRFSAVWQIIAEAGLEGEYQAWEEAQQ